MQFQVVERGRGDFGDQRYDAGDADANSFAEELDAVDGSRPRVAGAAGRAVPRQRHGMRVDDREDRARPGTGGDELISAVEIEMIAAPRGLGMYRLE